jgi:RNA polymerase sigma-70 factor (ECF subfamily)
VDKEAFVDQVARLVAQAAQGDHASFSSLVQLTQQPLFRRAYVQLGEQEEAEDVVQEVLIQAWRSLPRLRDPQAAWAWLCQMGYNVARDHKRKRKRTKQEQPLTISAETYTLIASWNESSDLTPEQHVISAELSALVKRAIDQLDEKHSAVILLREFGQFSYQEIAEMLGCSMSTVESRLHRARMKLKHQLKRLLEGGLAQKGRSA